MSQNLKDVIVALRKTQEELWGGFHWARSPEGHTYWNLQLDHLEALAKQLEENPKAYR